MIFKCKKQQTKAKLLGSYYTPTEVAYFLSKWAIRYGDKNLLEPSCGEGVFFEAIDKLSMDNPWVKDIEILGVDIDNKALKKASPCLTFCPVKREKDTRTFTRHTWIISVKSRMQSSLHFPIC